jgi:formyltetrahydrofolate-dependent phosphoribosylglycinamide formyltransferase
VALTCVGPVALSDPDNSGLLHVAAARHGEVALLLDEADVKSLAESEGPLTTSADMRRGLASKALRRLAESSAALSLSLETPATVLVVGSGGREHAIALKMAESPRVGQVVVTPGNGGMCSSHPKIMSQKPSAGVSNESVVGLAKTVGADLVVIGPEQPLVEGMADAMAAAGIACFGPSRKAAELEASKAWSKEFMSRWDIPTARYATFTDVAAALAHVDDVNYPVVIKASGLAAGKGVLMPKDKAEAKDAVESVMVSKEFGDAGNTVVIEEMLEGEEVSVLAICDGKGAVCMPGAQDHKRAMDGDEGLNTGGMGAYAPAPCLTPRLEEECAAICREAVKGMAAEGNPFIGVLFAGFMLTSRGPIVLEFNVRMGDPETQALLPLLCSDLYSVLLDAARGELKPESVVWKHGVSAAAVVVAAGGYPGPYPKGMPISGLDEAGSIAGVSVYHAGTALDQEGGLVTSGGRVLAVVGLGQGLQNAISSAYKGVSSINFSPMHSRTDIGFRALGRAMRVGVLGSGNGTSVASMLQAGSGGQVQGLNARIVMVISNKPGAGILDKAASAGVRHALVQNKSRAAFDAEVSQLLQGEGVDLVLLAGYMRILSPSFCRAWRGRCINVHPSLLPAFAGGMDLQVHEAVIAAGVEESGCTVHMVTEEVDGGPIVVQKKVQVLPGDTPESLKARVQAEEGPAFRDAIQHFLSKSKEGGSLTYKSAGVDIDAGNALIKRIAPACKATARKGCNGELGGFGGLFDLMAAGYDKGDTVLIGATDGVGTKLKLAQMVGDSTGVGIDLVAMCVNDLLVQGGEPLFFLDYFATGKLEIAQAVQVVESIAEGCKQAGCGLIGGETAEMPGMYAPGEYDLAGFAVGAGRRSALLPLPLGLGDVIIALPSSGVHSNGFSLVRKIIEKSGAALDAPPPYQSDCRTLASALLTPTTIYAKQLKPLLDAGKIKALAHITGGGLPENLPRAWDDAGLVAEIEPWTLPPVFKWMREIGGLSQDELLRAFNCGVGMCLMVSREEADGLLKELGPTAWKIGRMTARKAGQPQVVLAGTLQ